MFNLNSWGPVKMTVSTVINREQYEGNGVTTVYPYRFRILKDSHMVVTVVDPEGNLKTLSLGTDYDLKGVGLVDGGRVELKEPLATGWSISLDRDLPALQETDLRNQGKFFAEVHEDAFDYLTMLVQKTLSFFGLALRRPSWLAKYYDALGNKISNLADPTLNQDAATKIYVDSNISDSSNSIKQLINQEAQARQAGDDLLDQKIDTETEERIAADAALQKQITGETPVTASAFSVISWHKQTVDNSVDIPAGVNAWSIGPTLTISPGQRVTVGQGSFWTIVEGELTP